MAHNQCGVNRQTERRLCNARITIRQIMQLLYSTSGAPESWPLCWPRRRSTGVHSLRDHSQRPTSAKSFHTASRIHSTTSASCVAQHIVSGTHNMYTRKKIDGAIENEYTLKLARIGMLIVRGQQSGKKEHWSGPRQVCFSLHHGIKTCVPCS